MPSWRPGLAQETPAAAPAAAPASVAPAAATAAKPPIIDSSLVAFGVDVVGVISTFKLFTVANKLNSRMAILWGLVCGGLVVKGLADLSNVRER
jgi:hypothetical protein